MKKILITIIGLVFSANTFGDAKIITCEITGYTGGGERYEKFQGILETDDFSKDSPEYEYTLLEDSIAKDEDFIRGGLVDWLGIGKTYRYPFEVTATTITLKQCMTPENEPCTNSELTSKTISREDLSILGLMSTLKGQCSIEDYGKNNLI